MAIRHPLAAIPLLAIASAAVLAPSAAADEPPSATSLARRARALLSDRCFACHGPDSASRQADLRLDDGSSYIGDSDDALVVRGDPSASELVRRIRSDDEWEQMPPPDSHLSLTDDEITLLVRWVEQGARWADHWAFVPPDVALPDSASGNANASEPAHPVDAFVRRRLQQEGLEPNATADKSILLRRVTLDLTGLPPTTEELDAFLADQSPDAYERVVDRLLVSPRFGERMATDWLDAARYADTYGYQADRFRRVWPWRDWVVRAINDNLPYDEFLTWQLAGDQLPDATQEQRLATAFNRLHRETNEGGSIPAEFRAENVADRVNTVGAAVLGLTLECARCHDHKFDPISQRDYYAMAAYFDNTGELGLYSHFTDATPTPALDLSTTAQRKQLDELETRVRALEQQQHGIDARAVPAGEGLPEPPAPAGRYGFDELSDDEKLVGEPARIEGPGGRGSALSLDGENGWAGPPHAMDRSQPFSLSIWVRPASPEQSAVIVHRSQAWLDAAGRGYQITLDGGRPGAALVHFWPGDAIQVRAAEPLPAERWTHLALTYDGSSRAGGLRLYVNGRRAETETLHDSLTRTIRYAERDLAADKNVRLTVGHRFRDVGFKGGAVDELGVYTAELTPVEVASLAGLGESEVGAADWREHHLRRHTPAWTDARARLQHARLERDVLRDAIPQIATMADLPERRPSYLLERGAYDSPGEEVEPAPPAAIASDLTQQRGDRLGLARWVTSRENPLTARVAVNRFWQSLFGRGLVATPNDFGSQGAAPTHPDLLDWLAVRFVESGWDVKQLVRLIVTSETYRQSSVASPELREADPQNELLARGPSGRLSAEALRDSALAVGGLLVEQIGGPPVHPFQPPGLWEEKGAATYRRDAGPGSHRRSLYTIWKRTSPPPSMMTFDAADREVCTMRREATATPLQALVLLNDPQYVEAACGLAESVAGDALAERLENLWRRATSRAPTEAESAVLRRLYHEQLEYFQQDRHASATLLSVGDRGEADPDPEAAAMAATALAVLNHDAFVMKR
ncbi:DUF1553 domain-containing protein [Botrimarina sp.]|uniref:DUF1553 domain-containing protein n=1 Tax=Botrimarina sp. TaxID=2795802 RepID=UPI0032EE39D4